MAVANETTPGVIALTGDLAGGSNATLPQLTPTGVIPGVYKGANVVVDGKGRVLYATGLSELDVPCADTSQCGVVKVGHNLVSETIDEKTVLSLKKASASEYGVVLLGDGISRDCCEMYIDVPLATTDTVGSVIVGANVTVAGEEIDIATASTSVAGAVSIRTDNGLILTDDTVSFDTSTLVLTDATASAKGVVQVGAGLEVNAGIMSVPNASTSVKGIAQIGSGLIDTAGTMSIPTGSTSVKGLIKPGTALAVDGSGVMSTNYPVATTSDKGVVQVGLGLAVTGPGVLSVNLPVASNTDKGVVQAGAGVNIDGSGVISAVLADATTSTKGVVQAGTNMVLNASSVLSVPTATTSTKGVVQVGTRLTVDGSGVVSTNLASPSTAASNLAPIRIGTGLNVDVDGLVSMAYGPATGAGVGLVQVGNGLLVDGNGTLSARYANATTSGIINPVTSTDFIFSGGVISADTSVMARKTTNNTFTGTNADSVSLNVSVATTFTIKGDTPFIKITSLNSTVDTVTLDCTAAGTTRQPGAIVTIVVDQTAYTGGNPRKISLIGAWSDSVTVSSPITVIRAIQAPTYNNTIGTDRHLIILSVN